MQIVTEGPLHGYALTSLIEEKFGWKPSQTAIYNSLKSMESNDLVTVEERIEKGRVQKIYSITEQGKKSFEDTQQLLKRVMTQNFSQILSIAQMMGEIESQEESDAFQQNVEVIFESMKRISNLLLKLIREAPKETREVIENTYASLKEVAKKFGIQLYDDDNLS